MSVLLNRCVDGLLIVVLDCQAELFWNIILLLTQLQVRVHLLQLVQKVIYHLYIIHTLHCRNLL